ncbi:MAG: GNAT family N-acetyltransferase [Chloroflexi bacterium]|nr:GNAT family N-acetyltransferase [Chloroflexota bacterium]
MTTPDLHLRTCFVLDASGRIVAAREPSTRPAPTFCFVRDARTCAWAVHADVLGDIAAEVEALARDEMPSGNLREPPTHAERYASLLDGRVASGPAFSFPDTLPDPGEVVLVDDLRLLERNFRGWVAEEMPGCSPIVAILEDGHAVSVCFSARRSEIAAEAGLETTQTFRGRGLGPRVTAAWALAIRDSSRIPLYSTSWDNDASLAVARKLRLHAYASIWRISG